MLCVGYRKTPRYPMWTNGLIDQKLAADTELSVKNGAELLDRLVKDIVSESAAIYVSILEPETDPESQTAGDEIPARAFKLKDFIPLLQERIFVINPFTRTFLVSWITLLDSIPDLELVTFLPSFLGGLLRFLSDPNQDVHTITKGALDRFLNEIKKTSAIKRGIAESRKSASNRARGSSINSHPVQQEDKTDDGKTAESVTQPDSTTEGTNAVIERVDIGQDDKSAQFSDQSSINDDDIGEIEEDYMPGQDVQIDHAKIIDILLSFLRDSAEEEIQTTTLRWMESFFEICPEDILQFVPRLLAQVLPALSHDVEQVRLAADRVNLALTTYIMSLPEEPNRSIAPSSNRVSVSSVSALLKPHRDSDFIARRESSISGNSAKPSSPDLLDSKTIDSRADGSLAPQANISQDSTDLDYDAAVNSLTLQFLNEHENSRVAALSWLLMLHRKSPRKILAIQEGTFPALLKTLSDPSEAVVTRDLLLLSQICKNNDDNYFSVFMVSLCKLFCTDRRLLEMRGNLIIRQLCLNLSPERIYRTMADCLEKDEDIEFASIMVQNLNNNLITAPELADLRKRLRNMDTKEGQTFFVACFRSWCHNAVATFSLCLLAQAYEQAYDLLQIFTELEMTVNMLIQIDKLVQLLESPVFTYLRLQLLEPERFPYLYKCLYGLLMLLPQSSAFAALKNRLHSVSAVGFLQMTPRPPSSAGPTSAPYSDRTNRIKPREESIIRWSELLDKFRSTQERARRLQLRQQNPGLYSALGLLDPDDDSVTNDTENSTNYTGVGAATCGLVPAAGTGLGIRPGSGGATARPSPSAVPNSQPPAPPPPQPLHQKKPSGFSQLGRFARGRSKKSST